MKGVLLAVLCISLLSVQAQPGRLGGGSPQINAAMAKLFGDNQAFSATMEADIKMTGGQTMQLPGKMSFDSGKSRFEIEMSQAKGNAMQPGMVNQMKSMGMDSMLVISRPDEKTSYMIYPGLKAYAQVPLEEGDTKPEDFKVEMTELGKETVNGHACVKNRAIVTDSKGTKHESTIWNATDLKNFPVKIQTRQEGVDMTLLFKDVKLGKPEATQFNPPTGFKKYDNIMALMQQEVMRRMQESGGMPGAGAGEN